MADRFKKSGRLASNSCSSPGSGERELKEFLDRQGKQGSQQSGEYCNTPGDGGTARGRGDALLTTDEREVNHQGKYKEIDLPPPSLEALKDSQVFASSYAMPETGPAATAAPGKLNRLPQLRVDMDRMDIQPRHRGAVEHYFDQRPVKPSGK